MRSIQTIVKAERINMGGIYLDQALPVATIESIDPFLLIHHWQEHFKGGKQQYEIGVGPHPHRGFAPVTMIFKGSVHHRDSLGFDSIVDEGGTQWMNSGKGIIHSERPSKEIAENGGDFEIIQFWVNAPAKNKLDNPFYQPLDAQDTPLWRSQDTKIKAGIVAGEFGGLSSPIETYSPMLILRLDFEASGSAILPVPQNYNVLLYVLDGKITTSGNAIIGEKELVWYHNDSGEIHMEAIESGRAILLAGKPINEPIVNYGPFVMNSQSELMSAVKDYQAGKMGRLEEVFI